MGNPSGRFVHGMRWSGAYKSWSYMKSRVLSESNKDHKYYKKIFGQIEPRWLSFEEFYKDMGDRPRGLTLDRKDNSKGYFPWNCRWATRKEQAQNRRQCNGSKTKLSPESIREILADTDSLVKIGRKHGVGQTAVFNIKHGISWKEVAYV